MFAKKILPAIICLAILFSCTEEIIYEGNTGTLSGYVSAHPYHHTTPADSPATVTLSQNGKVISITKTDSSNNYYFHDVMTGLYDLTFSKDSFASTFHQGIQFVGGDIEPYGYHTRLRELSYITFDTLKYDATATTSTPRFNVPILDAKRDNWYRAYIDNQSDVSNKNYKITFSNNFYNYKYYTTDPYILSIGLYLPDLNLDSQYEFESGETVYLKIYPSAYGDQYMLGEYYIDKETGMKVYPVNEPQGTNTVSFIWP